MACGRRVPEVGTRGAGWQGVTAVYECFIIMCCCVFFFFRALAAWCVLVLLKLSKARASHSPSFLPCNNNLEFAAVAPRVTE